MKIYIASRMMNANYVKAFAHKIWTIRPDITFTQTWPDQEWSPAKDYAERAKDHEARQRIALRDLEDIDAADTILLLTDRAEEVWQGGMHFELGYGYGRGLRTFVVGQRCNVFHHLPRVQHFPNTRAFLEALQDGTVR